MLLRDQDGCIGFILAPVVWTLDTLLCQWLVRGIFTPIAVWMIRILSFGIVRIERESLEAVIYGWGLLLILVVATTVAALR